MLWEELRASIAGPTRFARLGVVDSLKSAAAYVIDFVLCVLLALAAPWLGQLTR